jgi:CBS domain-containing protein
MVYIERHKKLRQLTSLALRSGYSRIPVVGESLDDILGVVYLKDVMRRVYDNAAAESTERVESVMRPCMYVPDSKPVDQLLREMQAARMHVAIVVDEYGRPGHHRGHPRGDRRRDHRRVRRGAGVGAGALGRGLPGLQQVPDRRAR